MCVLGLTSLCVILDNLLWAPRNLKLPVRCSWRMFNIGLELLSWRQSKKEFKEKKLLPVPSWRRECKGRWMTLLEKAQPWDVLTSWIGGNTIWRNQEFFSPGSFCYGRNSITNCENFQFTLLKYHLVLIMLAEILEWASRTSWHNSFGVTVLVWVILWITKRKQIIFKINPGTY